MNERPYSKDTGYENSDVSAILSVRLVVLILVKIIEFAIFPCKQRKENRSVNYYLTLCPPFNRFIPGYPNKCPKLQIVPEKGLSEIDTEKLLALLHDQVCVSYNLFCVSCILIVRLESCCKCSLTCLLIRDMDEAG